MKRDLDLCRAILLAIEQHDAARVQVDVPGYSREQVYYHLQLLRDAGLIVSYNYGTGGVSFPAGERLTWSGHDFLDASRPSDRWQRAKARAESVGGVTFEVLKSILANLISSQLSL